MTNAEALAFWRKISEDDNLVETEEYQEAADSADWHSDARKLPNPTENELGCWAGYWAAAFSEDRARAELDAFAALHNFNGRY